MNVGEHSQDKTPPQCVCMFELTVDLDSDGTNGRDPMSVLSLAVVAPPLVAANVFYPQGFVVLIRFVQTVRGSGLSPTNLNNKMGRGVINTHI